MKIVNYNLSQQVSKILLFVFITTASVGQLASQNGKGMLGLNSIDLSEAQKTELRSIFNAHRSGWQEMKQNLNGDYQRFQIVKYQLELDLVAVLTSAQKEQYSAIKEYRTEKRRNFVLAKEQMMDEYRFNKRDKVLEKHNALQAKRTLLDTKISGEDKKTISALRINLRSGIKGWTNGYEDWQDKIENREKFLQDLVILRDLTDKYIDDINTLVHQDNDISNLFMQQNSCGGQSTFLSNRRAAIFLLLEADETDANLLLKSTLRAYPNPVQDDLTVEYKLPYSGEIELILTDESGNIVKRIYKGYKEEGTHEVKVNTKDLNFRSYILNLVDQTGNNFEKLIVTKEYDE